jgi:acetylglutamate kinase
MQAKLEAGMDALQKGAQQVLIAPGAFAGVVAKLLAGDAMGTRLIP